MAGKELVLGRQVLLLLGAGNTGHKQHQKHGQAGCEGDMDMAGGIRARSRIVVRLYHAARRSTCSLLSVPSFSAPWIHLGERKYVVRGRGLPAVQKKKYGRMSGNFLNFQRSILCRLTNQWPDPSIATACGPRWSRVLLFRHATAWIVLRPLSENPRWPMSHRLPFQPNQNLNT